MKNWSVLWIPLLSVVVRNDWYLWYNMNDSKVLPQNACSSLMEQFWNGLCYWSLSVEWIWVECAQCAYQWDGLLHDGWKEEHFVLEILIHSVIMCILYYCYMWLWYRKLYEREWKWMGMWLVVISKSDSISIIHNWKWMSNPANIVLKWVWTVIRHMLYIKWIIDADKTE